MVNKSGIVMILLLSASLFLNGVFVYRQLNVKPENQVKVIGIIDGDTVVLENKTRLRLRHMDAPEMGNCGSDEARKLLSSLVENKSIIIKEQIPDQTGRSMALIYVGNTFVNQAMLKSGFVRYHSDQTTQTNLLKETALEAKTNQLGIYSSRCHQTQNTDKPNCLIKGNLENKKKSGRKLYYLPGCAQYKFVIVERDLDEQWFCNEKEALAAGYSKAATCK